jgi:hypothetical protein
MHVNGRERERETADSEGGAVRNSESRVLKRRFWESTMHEG